MLTGQPGESSGHDIRSALASSFRSGSPLAEQALAQDIAAYSEDDCAVGDGADTAADELSEADHGGIGHPMFRRPSGVAYGGSRPVINFQAGYDEPHMNDLERKQSRNAERSLLRDNHLLPPKHPKKSRNPAARLYRQLFSTKLEPSPARDESPAPAVDQLSTETSPLLNGENGAPSDDIEDVERQWEEAVAAGHIRTTWQRETKTVVAYSGPLIVTFFLQYSINVAGIFAVGRLGTIELGAVSLANMSAAITCLAPFQGLATSLDTLCAQAYGSGHKHLVGLQFQRMSCFLLALTPPVAVLWWFAEDVLRPIIPEPESAHLAGVYLKIMILAIPGIILFECGKRFTQAQGLFQATTYVLIVAAPLNVFILWLLVWHLDYGFIGAPIAVAVTENILPVLLFLYVRFVDGSQCWGGFSRRALSNWGVMVRLALPGMIMVEAEWLAFEIMTLVASRFGSSYLAAQSAVTTLATISYQIPFPVSIAASTRIANLIGAGLSDAAKVTAKVTFVATFLVSILNLTLFSTLRFHLPLLFTTDPEVISIIADILPVVAVMQIFDGLCAGSHGSLRGIGKQSIGGPANLFAYYVVSLPISLGLAFGLGWKLHGLWVGVTIGLITAFSIEAIYLVRTDWAAAAREAEARNAAG